MDEELLTVMSLHALAYCERLFYLEEVEGIKLADERVYAGRTLHAEVLPDDPDIKEVRSLEVSSESLGLVGKVDAVRRRDGSWIPYEHKRGKAFIVDGKPSAWEPDALQVAAYTMLLEEYFGEPIATARIRYHASNVTVSVNIDDQMRDRVRLAIARARELRTQLTRPPISTNDRKCITCSLAPECLPEEERVVADEDWDAVRLFPESRTGSVVHLLDHSAKLRRSGNTFVVDRPGEEPLIYPVGEVSAFVVHGYGQVTTQALHLCASQGIPIHWVTSGGRYIASLNIGPGSVHKKLRQYQALSDPATCLGLARRLVMAKVEGQLRYLLRATRGCDRPSDLMSCLETMRHCLKSASHAETIDALRGYEGMAARAYFQAIPTLLKDRAQAEMYPKGRSKRPPEDRFNALLSFGYALLYQSVLSAILSVGLEPAIGFYHQPRTSGHPLVLDIMELFRMVIWDVPVIGSINRGQWDPSEDFMVTGRSVWLSDSGKAKAIKLYEERLADTWKHPVTQYSLSYERAIELEIRLLEKEWLGKPGLFARARLR